MGFNEKRSKIFYGWYIVAASMLITLYAGGVVHFGFTAIFEPIAEEFHWSYAQISLAASLRGLEIGLLAPVMGILVDRWGPRRLVFAGSIITCIGFLLLSRVSSLPTFYGAFALIAIGMSGCTQTVLMTAVTHWFRRKASVAIGIVASGVGFGGLMVPVVTRLIDILQWRMSMVTVGLGMLFIIFPLSLVVRHKPEQYGYQPDGEASSVVESGEDLVSPPSTDINISARQALRDRAFWYIAVSTACLAFVVGAVMTHIMPYLSSIGIARSISSLVALLLPVVSVVGRLGSGWLIGKFGSKKVLAFGFILMSGGLFIFGYITTGGLWPIVPFIVTLSLGWGCNVTTRITLLREYFGRDSFGTILGFTSGILMLGNIIGSPLAGWIFDTWGTYQGAWLGYGALTLVVSFLVFTIPSSGSTVRTTSSVIN